MTPEPRPERLVAADGEKQIVRQDNGELAEEPIDQEPTDGPPSPMGPPPTFGAPNPRGPAPVSEQCLDEELEETFPASDPSSHWSGRSAR